MSYFKLKERNTNVKTEIVAGISTFMAMAYILFINPAILSQGGATGISFESIFMASCLGMGLTSIAMGLIANAPFTLASGMGINAAIVASLIYGLGLSWQKAMGIVVIEGILVTILVLTRLRDAISKAIPPGLKYAMGAGIGLFLCFIGVQEAGFVKIDPYTGVSFGDLSQPSTLLALFGLAVTIAFLVFKIRGAILYGIFLTACAGIIFKIIPLPEVFLSIPTKESFSTFFKADIAGVFTSQGILSFLAISTVFLLLMRDLFETLGVVFGIGGSVRENLDFTTKTTLKRILLVDSAGSILGGLSGAGPITTAPESSVGVALGGRTGIVPITCGIMAFLCIFFSPIFAIVGGGVEVAEGIYRYPVTAPALIVAGFFITRLVTKIDFSDPEIAIPSFLTIAIMPFSYGIFYGIGFGFISYTFIKLIRGKVKELHPAMIVISVLFVVAFVALRR